MDLATACSRAKGTNSAVTGLSRGCCPKIRSSATHQRCFPLEQIAFLSVLSLVDRRGSLNSPKSSVGNGGGQGGIRHHPLSRRQPEPAHDIFKDHPAGRAAALAKVVPEHACQQADGTGGNLPDARCLSVDGEQPKGGSEALSSGHRCTLRKGGAKSGAAGIRRWSQCTASCTD